MLAYRDSPQESEILGKSKIIKILAWLNYVFSKYSNHFHIRWAVGDKNGAHKDKIRKAASLLISSKRAILKIS